MFYCRKTTDGTSATGWTDFVVPGSGDLRIRSGAALDPNGPSGPTVYFHCNNGYLYALNADTGAQRWRMLTGNAGGPPTVPGITPPYDQPLYSTPAVAVDGLLFVASANGHVYRFNPSSGAQLMDVTIGRPIEAPLVIGNNGWVYGATRSVNGVAQGLWG